MHRSLISRRLPLATLITALIGLAAALIVSACASASGASSDSAHISVSDHAMVHRVPKGFLGVSMEETSLEQYTGRNPSAIDPGFIGLLHNLQPSGGFVLRLGGDSSDWGWWPVPGMAKPAGIRFALTSDWTDIAREVATKLDGHLIVGINLEANNRRLTSYEATELRDHLGSSVLDDLELGNEPELYASFAWYTKNGVAVKGRPKGWDPAEYNSDFRSIASDLSGPLAGPASGGPEWLAELNTFAGAEPKVKLLTVHAYPLKHCSAGAHNTPADFFTNSSLQGLANHLAGYVKIGYHHHESLRIDEMNSITCGGQKGLSNAFAPALWALDMLPRLVETGAAGVNFHTVPGTIQSILTASEHGSSWSVGVEPEYYGLLAFAQAAPSGGYMLRVSSSDKNLDAWADRASGVEHIVLINSGSGAVSTSVAVKGIGGSAQVEFLKSPKGMLSTSGVTLGGQHISSSTGTLTGAPKTSTAADKNGSYTVRVPGSSAAILTIH